MPVSFVRNLGRAPGVQLNPLVDNSARSSRIIGDRSFGIPLRATRGRIDRAFPVTFNSLSSLLGQPELISLNAINEARTQLHEALAVSGASAIVSRLVQVDQAEIGWVVLGRILPVSPATLNTYVYGISDAPITGAVAVTLKDSDGVALKDSEGVALSEFVAANAILQIKHLGCHNDGIQVSVWAQPMTVGGVDQPSKVLHVRVSDADGRVMAYVVGSTDPTAKDDYNRSYYLPNVLSRISDAYEISVADNAVFSPGEALYGYNDQSRENRFSSGIMIAFNEGGTAYTSTDYQSAIDRLGRAQDDFSYLSSGGSQSAALLSQLSRLAFETNRQLRFDVDGSLDVTAAIAFVESLNLGAAQEAHLMQAFWMPVQSIDPSGVNPDGYLG
ncbi:MAG: hypothetical protein EOM21_19965, partial [Gammaproteobacteria bacterium]|nr:hypothetical protein [Gammaproteobacteria bacterium]